MIEIAPSFLASIQPMLTSLMIAFAKIGPLGLFLAAIIGNASIVLPMPTDLVFILIIGGNIDYFGMGILTVGFLGILYGTGAAIGELSGYFVGLFGISSFEKMKKSEVQKLKELKENLAGRGLPVIAFLAFIPVPFDVIGISAGLIRYPVEKFFLGCWIGKAARYFIFAYVVYFGFQWIGSVLKGTIYFWAALFALLLFILLVVVLVKKFYFDRE